MALGKAKVPERMLTLLHSVKQALWQLRHGTRLSADKGTDLNSELVGFLNRHSGKDGRGKGACEAVAGTYRVVHFHLRRRLIAPVFLFCATQDRFYGQLDTVLSRRVIF